MSNSIELQARLMSKAWRVLVPLVSRNRMIDFVRSPHRFVRSVAVSNRQTNLRNRRSLLFLAYAFPPVNMTASVRTWNIAKHLARLGWNVTVVTPKPDLWRHVGDQEDVNAQLESEGINTIKTGHKWRYLVPGYLVIPDNKWAWLAGGVCRRLARACGIDSTIGWIKEANKACSSLEARDVDLILASGPPFSTFRLAKQLGETLNCPYVLDYRDPWTGNPHSALPERKRIIAEEARLLTNAAAVTIVSTSWATALEERFAIGSKLHVVPNGYNPSECLNVLPQEFGHFAIVYTGTFYPPKRVISPLLAALRHLRDEIHVRDANWRFHYYGSHSDHVSSEARRFGIFDRVVIHGQVPRDQALAAVKGSNVVVVITSVSTRGEKSDEGIIPGKLFEAVGLAKPVLLIGSTESDAAEIVLKSGLGARFKGNDTNGMCVFLRRIMEGELPVVSQGTGDQWQWSRISDRLSTILRHAVDGETCIGHEDDARSGSQ